MTRRSLGFNLTLLLLSACGGGEVGGVTMDPPPPPPTMPPPDMPDPDPPEVPLDVDTLATTATCAALRPGERPLAVSPEGHLWLATSTGAVTRLRVLDGWDAAVERNTSIAVSQIEDARVWTATTASFVADGALYQLRDGERISVSSPIAVGPGTKICGDLSTRAFVVSDKRLIERIADEWIEWSGLDDVLTSSAALVARDGACWGENDLAWISSGRREIWELGPASITRADDMAGAGEAALLGDRLLVLRDGHLVSGPDAVKEWSFAAGDARVLAAAGSYAWILAGDVLLRFDGVHFTQLDPIAGAAIGALYPHASGGIWVQAEDRVCHLSPDAMVRVAGLTNGEQRTDSAFTIRAKSSGAAGQVTAAIDGVEIAPSSVDDGWVVFEGELALGWRTLLLTASDTQRELQVKGLPEVERSYAIDIQPIYTANCTGGACHSPGSTSGAPDLSTYEAWIGRAEKIRQRIVERQDMPPFASRSPDWGDQQITIINEWLSGGLRP